MSAPFIDLSVHHNPKGLSDRVAFGFTKLLRWTADTFFAERYGHRAVVLETVAAVPGMVPNPAAFASLNHVRTLVPSRAAPVTTSIGLKACTCIPGTRALTAAARSK